MKPLRNRCTPTDKLNSRHVVLEGIDLPVGPHAIVDIRKAASFRPGNEVVQ
jgi:hypothetical protein